MLRPASERDLALMRSWRNQQANRAVSLTQHEIGPEEHLAWWERTAADPSRRVLVFEADGTPRGVVSFFDLEQDRGSWGFYLDHDGAEAEGTTLLLWMRVMREAIAYAFDELGLDVLEGEVLGHNESVRAMNRRFGFVEGAAEHREIDGRRVAVHPVRLRREDRRGGAHRRTESESA